MIHVKAKSEECVAKMEARNYCMQMMIRLQFFLCQKSARRGQGLVSSFFFVAELRFYRTRGDKGGGALVSISKGTKKKKPHPFLG